jgi:hypothetical protein
MSDAARTAETQTRVTLVVPAQPGRIFDLLATPQRLPELDPTGTIVSVDSATPLTGPGQVFELSLEARGGHEALRYRAEHRVDAFERDHLIGWTVTPVDSDTGGWSWRFDLVPLDADRTEVTLTYDWSEISDENAARYGIPDHDSADLETCLTRLALAVRK